MSMLLLFVMVLLPKCFKDQLVLLPSFFKDPLMRFVGANNECSSELEELPSMETLTSLEDLCAIKCVELKNIHGLS